MELGVLCALLLICSAWGVLADVQTVYWNSTNKSFLWDDYTVVVRLNDYLEIVCPHYEDENMATHTVERYTLFLVDYEEYTTCKPISKIQVRWECNNPFAPHGPEKFREKFQKYTAFILGKEFKEGEDYYYISKPIHHHGESCLKLKVHVAGKSTQQPVTNVHTPRARILSDEPSENVPGVMKSVANSSCSRPLSFTLLGLLFSLVLTLGL
ncbi:ephrin-A1 [Hyperolius riggenbachi]|uniref:ephrin-A1 n=1 Tax=Hyperolius riggenbachi TaxID=752182 RepID=UPI0035A35926